MWRSLVIAAIVIELAVSGLLQIIRGANHGTRRYDISDVIGAAIEYPLIIWAIIWLANS